MEAAMEREGVETEKRQFCTFWISGRHFGVDILDVKEINSEVGFTPIFHAPKEVKGYVNIRGEIYLILDLGLILGFQSTEVDEPSRTVLFDSGAGEAFGVLVDSISDIVTVDVEQIENRPNPISCARHLLPEAPYLPCGDSRSAPHRLSLCH